MKIGVIGASGKVGLKVIEELFNVAHNIPSDTTFVLYAPHSAGQIKATLEELFTTTYSDDICIPEKSFIVSDDFTTLKESHLLVHLASSTFPNDTHIQKIAKENPDLSLRDIMSWDNYCIIKDNCEKIKEHKMKSDILIITNQVDTFSSLAREWLGSQNNNIWGLGGSVDTARFKRFLSTYLNKKNITNNDNAIQSKDIQAFVGGYHNEFMPLFENYFKIEGVSAEIIKKIPLKQLMQKTIAEVKDSLISPKIPEKNQITQAHIFSPERKLLDLFFHILAQHHLMKQQLTGPFYLKNMILHHWEPNYYLE